MNVLVWFSLDSEFLEAGTMPTHTVPGQGLELRSRSTMQLVKCNHTFLYILLEDLGLDFCLSLCCDARTHCALEEEEH